MCWWTAVYPVKLMWVCRFAWFGTVFRSEKSTFEDAVPWSSALEFIVLTQHRCSGSKNLNKVREFVFVITRSCVHVWFGMYQLFPLDIFFIRARRLYGGCQTFTSRKRVTFIRVCRLCAKLWPSRPRPRLRQFQFADYIFPRNSWWCCCCCWCIFVCCDAAIRRDKRHLEGKEHSVEMQIHVAVLHFRRRWRRRRWQ